MAIVVRTYLDCVLVQFASGAEHQLKKPGEIEGAHFTEIEYLVDDATGAVVGKTNNPLNGHAQPLDPAKVSALLGEQFAGVAAQLAALDKQICEERAAAAEQAASLSAAHADELKARDDQIAALTLAHQGARGDLAASLQALADGLRGA
jgi:hypothetical protein